jgi:hypothetical protein
MLNFEGEIAQRQKSFNSFPKPVWSAFDQTGFRSHLSGFAAAAASVSRRVPYASCWPPSR